MPPEIPSADELTAQAFRFRKENKYAAHPVEAALRYHRSQAEKSGTESHGGFDFESAEVLYRASAQGLRLSEIPQLPQSLEELSRLGAVDRAARSGLRRHIENHGPVYGESHFLAAWEAQGRRGGAEHHVHHDQDRGRWFKRLHRKRPLARHYYDLWSLIQKGIAAEALADAGLFERVAAHRQMFFTYRWMDYTTLKPGSLRLLPHPDQLSTWRGDYSAMRTEMFFGDVPAFDEILRVVGEFEKTFNAIA